MGYPDLWGFDSILLIFFLNPGWDLWGFNLD